MATSPKKRGLQDKGEQECLGQRQWTPGYEYEYCQYESELQDKKRDCKKHPEHDGFIAVSDFNLQHLPESHRDNIVWKFIQTVISLTVRVVVIYTSIHRPESNYPNSDRRGSYGMTFGSGTVRKVCRKSTEEDGGKCPCRECEKFPDTAKTKWAQFDVRTAAHVVFNSEECKQTRCDVGFDRDEDRGKCHKLDGLEVRFSKTKRDYCFMWCVSHNEDVINKMEEMVSRYDDLCGKLGDKYNRSEVDDMFKQPVICVSHPHGMAKQITVGRFTGGEWGAEIRYSTKTCAGSSGGAIYRLWRWWWDRRVVSAGHTLHSKSLHAGENQSGGVLWWS